MSSAAHGMSMSRAAHGPPMSRATHGTQVSRAVHGTPMSRATQGTTRAHVIHQPTSRRLPKSQTRNQSINHSGYHLHPIQAPHLTFIAQYHHVNQQLGQTRRSGIPQVQPTVNIIPLQDSCTFSNAQQSYQYNSQFLPVQNPSTNTSTLTVSPTLNKRTTDIRLSLQGENQLNQMPATNQKNIRQFSNHMRISEDSQNYGSSQTSPSSRHQTVDSPLNRSRSSSPIPTVSVNDKTVGQRQGSSLTPDYQPVQPPSGAPPSYEMAMSSSYHERMKEYDLEWDKKRNLH